MLVVGSAPIFFNLGYFEDHWVGEYWNTTQARWFRVDAKIDPVQQEFFKIDFNSARCAARSIRDRG